MNGCDVLFPCGGVFFSGVSEGLLKWQCFQIGQGSFPDNYGSNLNACLRGYSLIFSSIAAVRAF
jgi:hypothetical protein